MMNNNNTSNFNNNPSDPSKTYVYCYMGLASGFLLLMLSITLFSHYCCTTRNPENHRRQRRGGGSSSNNSNRTVLILVETADNSVVTIDVCEEQREAILNGFPVLLYSQVLKPNHKADDSTSLICSICLADYKESEWLRLVPDCGHYFHKECVDAWFRLNLSCPMCRNSPLTTPLAQVTPLPAITRHDDSVVETAAQSVTIRIQ